MEDVDEDYGPPRGILTYIKDILLTPIRIALSPALLRTYLRTVLVLLTSGILFAVAIVAYTSFYYAYIPVRGIEVPVYLQFDHSQSPTNIRDTKPIGAFRHDPREPTASQIVYPHDAEPPYSRPTTPARAPAVRTKFPYGIANIAGLISRQKYDVVVRMTLPRSETNLHVGNWMLGLELRGPTTVGGGLKGMLGWDEEWEVDDFSYGPDAGREKEAASEGPDVSPEKPIVLARSRRPGILTYRSWITETAYRLLRLPLYALGWVYEAETVEVKMMETISFDKGWRNVPTSLRLEVRSKTPLEVYKVSVKMVARLEGLRRIMYQHRVTSFVVFTSLFWSVEMGVLLTSWAIFTLLFGSRHEEYGEQGKAKRIKTESSAPETPKTEPATSAPSTPLSDTSRTFPTLSSHAPLRYSSGTGEAPKIKGEPLTPRLEDIPPRTEAEADDEDEEADYIMDEPLPTSAAHVLTDSGIGTSMESGRDRDQAVVRRRSGGSRDKER